MERDSSALNLPLYTPKKKGIPASNKTARRDVTGNNGETAFKKRIKEKDLMTQSIYNQCNQSFECTALRVHEWIEKKSGLEVRTGQSTIWEYKGTPAQNLLIEGGVTLEELKRLFPDGTALDKYGWTIPVDSVYIRVIPITRCPDGTAMRENGTTIALEDMAHIEMVKEKERIERTSGHTCG